MKLSSVASPTPLIATMDTTSESPRPFRYKRATNEEKVAILEAAKELGIRKVWADIGDQIFDIFM